MDTDSDFVWGPNKSFVIYLKNDEEELAKWGQNALDSGVRWGEYLPNQQSNRRFLHAKPTVFEMGFLPGDEIAFWESYVVLPEPQKSTPSISPSVPVSSTAPRSRTSGMGHAFWIFLRDGPLPRLLAYAAWILFVILVVELSLPEVPALPPDEASAPLSASPLSERLAKLRSSKPTVEQRQRGPELQGRAGPDLRPYDNAIRAAFGDCGDPCVVRNNPGGTVATFAFAAEGLLAGARKGLIIDGPCASACSFAADLARKVTCITPRAVFGFHRTSDEQDLRYSAPIMAMVRDAAARSPEIKLPGGGLFPSNVSHKLIWMLNETASEFWQSCASADFIRKLHHVDPQ